MSLRKALLVRGVVAIAAAVIVSGACWIAPPYLGQSDSPRLVQLVVALEEAGTDTSGLQMNRLVLEPAFRFENGTISYGGGSLSREDFIRHRSEADSLNGRFHAEHLKEIEIGCVDPYTSKGWGTFMLGGIGMFDLKIQVEPLKHWSTNVTLNVGDESLDLGQSSFVKADTLTAGITVDLVGTRYGSQLSGRYIKGGGTGQWVFEGTKWVCSWEKMAEALGDSEEATITFTVNVDIHAPYVMTLNGRSTTGTTHHSKALVMGTIEFSHIEGEVWIEYDFPIYQVLLVPRPPEK